MPPNKETVMESKGRRDVFTAVPDNEGAGNASEDLPPNIAASDVLNIRRDCGGIANILDTACNQLSAAAERLEACEKVLTKSCDSSEETPSLASQARLHNIKRLQGAVNELPNVIRRLSASLVQIIENGARPERVFTPVLVNTIAKEASEMKRLTDNLTLSAKDVVSLERETNLIRDVVRRCVDAFEPTRLAIFRPDRRHHHSDSNKDASKVGNMTREYLRGLDVDWEGLGRVKEALPAESKLPSLVEGTSVGEESLSEEYAEQLFMTGSTRYWPV